MRSSKRVLLESPFLLCLCPLRFSGVSRTNLKGCREEPDSPKTPFWTTGFPHDAFSALLTPSEKRELTEFCGKLGEFCEKLGEFALAHS